MHGALAVAGGERRGSVRISRKRKPSQPVLDTALAAVMSGGTPDVSSDETLGIVYIEDPYEERDYFDGKIGRPQKRAKVLSFKHDPIGQLYARDQIDEAQYQAGRRWQRDFEAAEISNLRAIDFTRDVVDGGVLADPISDHRTAAIDALARYDRVLGHDGSHLIRLVLGNHKQIQQVADLWGYENNEAARTYLGKRFRECLNTLAEEMGLATNRRPKFPQRLDNPPAR